MPALRLSLALVSLAAAPAAAGALPSSAASHLAPGADTIAVNARRKQATPPLKDCTPWNGRSGFYGNIFCTEREQELWERRGRRTARR
jgi:hypothetical protein